MEEITDYDTDCENKFAFAPNKFFTPPVLQQQSTFLDIFSDVDLQMLLGETSKGRRCTEVRPTQHDGRRRRALDQEGLGECEWRDTCGSDGLPFVYDNHSKRNLG